MTIKEINSDLLCVFQDLYDSEINFTISTFWDGGFDVKLGDDLRGFVADWTCDTMIQAAAFLKIHALIHFPASTFSKNIKRRKNGNN